MKLFLLSVIFLLGMGRHASAQYACSGDQFMNGTIASIGLQCGSPSASGYMKGSNNLSDIGNAASSRTNLGLATVASSGSYTDLTNKPTIPAAAKLYVGTSSTVGTGGIATFNISASGFTGAPTACLFNATTGTATPGNSYNAVGLVATAWTSSQVQAYVTQPIAILIGGLGVGAVGAGVSVQAVCYP